MPETSSRADWANPPVADSGKDEPVFAEPWHAQLFAITIKLSDAGHFTWPEWSEHFGATQAQASRDGAPSDGSGYYDAWLDALESLLIKRGVASENSLSALKQAWTDAYLATPHGQPVVLQPATRRS